MTGAPFWGLKGICNLTSGRLQVDAGRKPVVFAEYLAEILRVFIPALLGNTGNFLLAKLQEQGLGALHPNPCKKCGKRFTGGFTEFPAQVIDIHEENVFRHIF